MNDVGEDKPTQAASESVYVVGSPAARPVKIGRSVDPASRLASLQAGSPVELCLLATFPGGPRLEKHLHGCFARQRIHGEWFDFRDEDPLALITGEVEAYEPDPGRPDRARTPRSASEISAAVLDLYTARAPGGDPLFMTNLRMAEVLGTSPVSVKKALARLVAEGRLVAVRPLGRVMLHALAKPVPRTEVPVPRPRLRLVHSAAEAPRPSHQ
ncbi:GIY-YIG nuclease family protein [Kitasatospora sp. NPDC098652]|uniref:GIY-YIG nuclease family protein n=1 Tax=Kitasatospora sp. NPDC098652 TaxID=3364095 RepID=UPI00382A98B4